MSGNDLHFGDLVQITRFECVESTDPAEGHVVGQWRGRITWVCKEEPAVQLDGGLILALGVASRGRPEGRPTYHVTTLEHLS